MSGNVGAWGKKLVAVLEKYKFVLLVAAVGAALLLLPSGTAKKEAAAAPVSGDLFQVSSMEDKLEQALSQVEGAGKVTVVLTLKDGPRQVLAQDGTATERDGETQREQTTVIVGKGSGGEDTVTLQELSPSYQGALVVAAGGDDPQVRLKLTEAVSALTGLGTDKISICKGK